MFEKAKIEDKVWSPIYGWGTIIKLNNYTPSEIMVKFENNRRIHYETYLTNGKRHKDDINPVLFWNEFEIPKEAFVKQVPDLKIDTKVIVWNTEGMKFKRYFSHFGENGKIWCFSSGRTSWSSDGTTRKWDNWELYEGE